ncbi:hypothetical protein DFH29DRAFT_581800 [Suillus ampliporus]|nr:hypothetical protein DFH29DRAFT_581800 [Suillus ampliporus]
MSSSPKVLAIRAYIDRLDNNDLDGAHQYVTDDFVYVAEPKPVGILGKSYVNEAGFNKDGFKAFMEESYKHVTIKTTIEDVTENPETGNIIVRTKTKQQQIVT